VIETGALSNKQKMQVAHQLLTAVYYLHCNNVIHRDIKPDNVLMDEEMRPILADFSLAKVFDGKCTGTTHTPDVGTPTYRAPEVYEGEGEYGLPSDCWAVGVVLLEMFSGKIMPAQKDKAALDYVEQCKAKLNQNAVSVMLRGLLDVNPFERSTAEQALRSEFFKNIPFPEESSRVVLDKMVKAPEPETKQPKKGKKGGDKFEVAFEALEGQNPVTVAAARVYHERSGCPEGMCVMLAHKMYEEELFDPNDAAEMLKIDLEEYARAEQRIFRAMEYCLFA
jgi:serine/threonine protein kinase